MFSAKPFIYLSEFRRKVHAFLFTHLSSDNTLFSFILFTSLLLAPSLTLAEDKQPVDSSQKNNQTRSTEGLLASTEQMI